MEHEVPSPEQAADVSAWWGKAFEALRERAVKGHSQRYRSATRPSDAWTGRGSVTEVSRAVGYSSASHFIKEFRSRFGTTPRAYVDAQALGDQMAALRQA